MNNLRACWRLLRVLGHILKGLAIVAVRFPALSPDQQHARVQAWSMQLLARAGVSLRILGTPPVNGPVMLVANHISWLDIPVMHAARHCRFVAKSDVQAWPLVGTLATAAGTLYIERNSRRDALRMVRSMHEALERGDRAQSIAEFGQARRLAPDSPVIATYLAEPDGWAVFNPIYAEFFGSHQPARAIVPTAPFPGGFKVEVDAIAVLG